jgi:hypothetical protein
VVLAVVEGEYTIHFRYSSLFREPMLQHWTYERVDGEWREMGGGGSGGDTDPLLARTTRQFQEPLQSDGGGASGLVLGRRSVRKWLQHVEVLCAPNVARVEIVRQDATRTADVSSGPGWLAVPWTSDMPTPTLTAFDREGRHLGVLIPEQHHMEYKPPLVLRLPRPMRRLVPNFMVGWPTWFRNRWAESRWGVWYDRSP